VPLVRELISEPVGTVIVGLSLFASGALAWQALLAVRKRHWRGVALWLGVASIIGLVAWAVFLAGPLPPTWRAFFYTVALAAVFAGATEPRE
jgi:hypothetical protein